MSFLICPLCHGSFEENTCNICKTIYQREQGILKLLVPHLEGMKKQEATYHDIVTDSNIETHQLNTFRNIYYHNRIIEPLKTIPSSCNVLEIACGSGYDALNILKSNPKISLTLADISFGALKAAKNFLQKNNQVRLVEYIQCDGENLPFKDNSFDAVVLISGWHHMPSPKKSLSEIRRCVKPGGYVIIGMEPSKFFSRCNAILKPILKLFIQSSVPGIESQADENMMGFGRKEIIRMFISQRIAVIKIIPVWFLSAALHYSLEIVFRLLRLKKRIHPSFNFEKIFIYCDEFFFLFPPLRNLCFHWIIFGKKIS